MDDRVEVTRGTTTLLVVKEQVEHWESLGYTAKTDTPKRTTRKRTTAKEA